MRRVGLLQGILVCFLAADLGLNLVPKVLTEAWALSLKICASFISFERTVAKAVDALVNLSHALVECLTLQKLDRLVSV